MREFFQSISEYPVEAFFTAVFLLIFVDYITRIPFRPRK